jgi:DNA-binding HxlR family transcriptional regulator
MALKSMLSDEAGKSPKAANEKSSGSLTTSAAQARPKTTRVTDTIDHAQTNQAKTLAKGPGQKVRGSQSGRPIMVLLDVLGQRWTLRILWELGDIRANFRVLRLKCDDLSPTLLNKRLKHLRELGLVDLDNWGYGLTAHGKELAGQLVGLDVWATAWAKSLAR